MLAVIGVAGMLIVSLIFFAVTTRRSTYPVGGGTVGLFVVGPLQDMATGAARFVRNIWRHYFALASVARENDELNRELARAVAENNRYREMELSTRRLRELLNFYETADIQTFAAEVVARDPSGWFKTVIIDKGSADGVRRGMAVVVAQGIVGQVVDVSRSYAKVLLIIDSNSSVDGVCQRTRARGLVKGAPGERCDFVYVLRKDDVTVGDSVISSGLDGIYPKGLPIGRVSAVVKRNAGLFQAVEIDPYVNFDRLEEVLVILNVPRHEFQEEAAAK